MYKENCFKKILKIKPKNKCFRVANALIKTFALSRENELFCIEWI